MLAGQATETPAPEAASRRNAFDAITSSHKGAGRPCLSHTTTASRCSSPGISAIGIAECSHVRAPGSPKEAPCFDSTTSQFAANESTISRQSVWEPVVMPLHLCAEGKGHPEGTTTSQFAAHPGTIGSHSIRIWACQHVTAPGCPREASSLGHEEDSVCCR